MVDKSSGGKGAPTVGGEVKDYLQKNSYWAVGGLACYLKYNAMKTIVRNRMVTGAPALLFVSLYGLVHYKGYQTATKQLKENGKDTFERIKQIKSKQ